MNYTRKRSAACKHTQNPDKGALLSKKCPILAFIREKNRMDQHFKRKHYYTIK
jgi:hypothetical protein